MLDVEFGRGRSGRCTAPAESGRAAGAPPAGKDIANAAAERAAKALGPGKSLSEQNIEDGIKGWAQMGVDISEAGIEAARRAKRVAA